MEFQSTRGKKKDPKPAELWKEKIGPMYKIEEQSKI